MEKIFDFKNKEFGLVCSGEMIMRLSPLNNEMLVQGHMLEKQMGGAEFNVASGVSILGEKTAVVTKLPKNELGKFAKKIIDSNGVSDEFVVYDESKNKRLAIYYYEYGSSPRKPNVTYDRQNSSFQSFKADEVNSSVYNRTEIFHTSGITLGLCETSNKLTHDLIKNFKDGGALISFDVNFRRNLWTEEEARVEIEKLLPSVDILFASEETFRKMFQKTGNLEEIIRAFAKEFNISFIASTQRTVNSPKSHNFTSLIYNRKNDAFYCESPYKNIEIVDRIGSGDAYVAGVLYGILKHNNPEKAMKYGNANSVLKNTIIGDISCADVTLVDSIIADHENGSTSEMNR
ncbi:sugar kinase [Fusobacterium ulcerans]|uniref:sugar kinase n=1 Tax=Fusobacterium ulcerans TaxID=861 RepID=UPI002E7697F8|nr:sugar kinase [Fusobacterium ulcerans]MEE0138529.1 sugar kinase [Fusobacterium ulcerans]